MGPFEIIYDGRGGHPGAAPGSCARASSIRSRCSTSPIGCGSTGWQVPAYTLPANRQDLAIQRILVRHDFSRDMASLLLDDYRRALAHLDAHPRSVPLDASEASGFRH